MSVHREDCDQASAERPQLPKVRLHKTAPWNGNLRRTYREWYTQVAGRYFMVSAEWLYGMWTVEEITANGGYIAVVEVTFNLTEAREAITRHVAGVR